MDTIWTWGWCLIPLIFFGIIALAFFARRGPCGCGCRGADAGNSRDNAGSAAR